MVSGSPSQTQKLEELYLQQVLKSWTRFRCQVQFSKAGTTYTFSWCLTLLCLSITFQPSSHCSRGVWLLASPPRCSAGSPCDTLATPYYARASAARGFRRELTVIGASSNIVTWPATKHEKWQESRDPPKWQTTENNNVIKYGTLRNECRRQFQIARVVLT